MGSDNLFHKNKIRKASEFARQKAKRSPYPTIHIICEDTKSSCSYLKKLRQYFRLNTANIIVLPSKGSAPINVVNHAIEIAQNTLGVDIIACVIDRDDHVSYASALDKITKHKPKRTAKSNPEFKVYASNPCFEIWLLLHFIYSTKSYNRTGTKSAADNLISDLVGYLPRYDKSDLNWFDEIIKKTDNAINNAKKLQKYNEETKSVNPATNLHELVEILMRLQN